MSDHQSDQRHVAFFEPWALGDAIIAASVLSLAPNSGRRTLLCNPTWIPLIKAALSTATRPSIEFEPVLLPYTIRGRSSPIELGKQLIRPHFDDSIVYSIRGDLRDYSAARRILPKAMIRMTGYDAFLARRSRAIDWLLLLSGRPIRNRYEAWCTLSGVRYTNLEESYRRTSEGKHTATKLVTIHVGAQWRSKQYPWTMQLRNELIRRDLDVELWAGPKDPLPDGILERDIKRLDPETWISGLKRAALAIVNDSGAMHFSALAGVPTLAIARVSNIHEWNPPLTTTVCSREMPHGYMPHPDYATDRLLGGWPSFQEIAATAEKKLST